MNKKIYFAGSIRGGRVDAALYQRIIQYINKTEVCAYRTYIPYETEECIYQWLDRILGGE